MFKKGNTVQPSLTALQEKSKAHSASGTRLYALIADLRRRPDLARRLHAELAYHMGVVLAGEKEIKKSSRQ